MALTTTELESVMFLTAKFHLVSGMIIGAIAVMAAKQMCREGKTDKQSTVPSKFEDRVSD